MTSRAGNRTDLRLQTSDISKKTFLKSGVWSLESDRGFTLIELALVAVVLAVLIVAAVPNMQRRWVNLQTERVASQLAQTLRAVRTLAITTQGEADWLWDDAARQVCVGEPQTQRCAEVDPRDPLKKPRAVPEPLRITLEQNRQPVSRVRFLPDGTSQSTTIVIHDEVSPRYALRLDGPTSQVVVQTADLSSPR